MNRKKQCAFVWQRQERKKPPKPIGEIGYIVQTYYYLFRQRWRGLTLRWFLDEISANQIIKKSCEDARNNLLSKGYLFGMFGSPYGDAIPEVVQESHYILRSSHNISVG